MIKNTYITSICTLIVYLLISNVSFASEKSVSLHNEEKPYLVEYEKIKGLSCQICFQKFDRDTRNVGTGCNKCDIASNAQKEHDNEHYFCYPCLLTWLNTYSKSDCPTCRNRLNGNLNHLMTDLEKFIKYF